MARCEVSIHHSRIRKNTFLEDAKDDADAIRQFHEQFDLPELPGVTWSPQVNWLGAPTPKPAADAKSPPKSAAEAIAAEVAKGPASVADLKQFGLTDSDVLKLEKAKLTTISAVDSYGKANKGLKGIPGIDAVLEHQIKAAIRSYQNSQL